MLISRLINNVAVNFSIKDAFVEKTNVPFLVTDREGYLISKAMEDPTADLSTDSDAVNDAIAVMKELRKAAEDLNRKVTINVGVEFADDFVTFAVTKNGRVFASGLDKAGVTNTFGVLERKYSDPRRRIRVIPGKNASEAFIKKAESLEDAINDGLSEGDIRRFLGVFGADDDIAVIGISKKAVRKERGVGEFSEPDTDPEDDEE